LLVGILKIMAKKRYNKNANIAVNIASSVKSYIDNIKDALSENRRRNELLSNALGKGSPIDTDELKGVIDSLQEVEREHRRLKSEAEQLAESIGGIELFPRAGEEADEARRFVDKRVADYVKVAVNVGSGNIKPVLDLQMHIKDFLNKTAETRNKFLSEDDPAKASELLDTLRNQESSLSQLILKFSRMTKKASIEAAVIDKATEIMKKGAKGFTEGTGEAFTDLKSGIVDAFRGNLSDTRKKMERIQVTAKGMSRASKKRQEELKPASGVMGRLFGGAKRDIERTATHAANAIGGFASIVMTAAPFIAFAGGLASVVAFMIDGTNKIKEFNRNIIEGRGASGIGISISADVSAASIESKMQGFYRHCKTWLSDRFSKRGNRYGIGQEEFDSVQQALKGIYLPRFAQKSDGVNAEAFALTDLVNYSVGVGRMLGMSSDEAAKLITTWGMDYNLSREDMDVVFGNLYGEMEKSAVSGPRFMEGFRQVTSGYRGFGTNAGAAARALSSMYKSKIFGSGQQVAEYVSGLQNLLQDEDFEHMAAAFVSDNDFASIIETQLAKLDPGPTNTLTRKALENALSLIRSGQGKTPFGIGVKTSAMKYFMNEDTAEPLLLKVLEGVLGHPLRTKEDFENAAWKNNEEVGLLALKFKGSFNAVIRPFLAKMAYPDGNMSPLAKTKDAAAGAKKDATDSAAKRKAAEKAGEDLRDQAAKFNESVNNPATAFKNFLETMISGINLSMYRIIDTIQSFLVNVVKDPEKQDRFDFAKLQQEFMQAQEKFFESGERQPGWSEEEAIGKLLLIDKMYEKINNKYPGTARITAKPEFRFADPRKFAGGFSETASNIWGIPQKDVEATLSDAASIFLGLTKEEGKKSIDRAFEDYQKKLDKFDRENKGKIRNGDRLSKPEFMRSLFLANIPGSGIFKDSEGEDIYDMNERIKMVSDASITLGSVFMDINKWLANNSNFSQDERNRLSELVRNNDINLNDMPNHRRLLLEVLAIKYRNNKPLFAVMLRNFLLAYAKNNDLGDISDEAKMAEFIGNMREPGNWERHDVVYELNLMVPRSDMDKAKVGVKHNNVFLEGVGDILSTLTQASRDINARNVAAGRDKGVKAKTRGHDKVPPHPIPPQSNTSGLKVNKGPIVTSPVPRPNVASPVIPRSTVNPINPSENRKTVLDIRTNGFSYVYDQNSGRYVTREELARLSSKYVRSKDHYV